MRALNLGIVAHVDAGKTTLTERLLHHAGVIDEVGSVDAGTTHTDFLDLERQRGITIKAAVVSFPLGDVTVNLIDTPGHPDFIAEVERSLGVLDGAVLVVSAVEGVQAQTRVLMRALQRLRTPTILFVNKIDRVGADPTAVVRAIRERLTPDVLVMGEAVGLATRAAAFHPLGTEALDASVLAEHDDGVLEALVKDRRPAAKVVRRSLRRQARRGLVHPAFFGSAITGAGVSQLADGLTELLPTTPMDPCGDLSASVFKIERGTARERIALVRVFRGSITVRQRFGERERTVTGIEVFSGGGTERRQQAVAGEIARVWGLGKVRVGDSLGEPSARSPATHFAPPTLETVVLPTRPAQRSALHSALTELAEQDPLIGVRHDDVHEELHLSLYGEVQKEVIGATLATEFGVEVEFRESTPICIERVVGTSEAIEHLPRGGRSSLRPFLAGIGLRVEPAPVGSGITFDHTSQLGYLIGSFVRATEETVRETLRQGLCGWEVPDCKVTLTHSQYYPRQSHAHQGFSKAMSTIASDFRFLTPLVLMAALREAGTVVCEPIDRYELEVPADVVPVMVPLLARFEAPPSDQVPRRSAVVLTGHVRAAVVHALQQQLPDLTRGEGVLECAFDSYRPVHGPTPVRPRIDANPLDRREYLLRVTGAVAAGG